MNLWGTGLADATTKGPPCGARHNSVLHKSLRYADTYGMALLFKRKTSVERLETELAALRARAKTLGSRHTAADAALVDAKAKLQAHLLEADLDGDEKARTKLEAAVAACVLTRDGLADALAEVQTRIAGAEKAIEAERAAVQRNAAADMLSRELDEIEKAIPGYLAASRRFADAIEAVGHWHFDCNQMGVFARNTQAQIEVAAAVAVEELRRMVNAIRDGGAQVPPRKPEPTLIAPLSAVADPAVVQEPPTSYHPLKGGPTFKGPVARSPKIDAALLAATNFRVVDRSSEDRKIAIAVPRV
jgi:hypothetical protein